MLKITPLNFADFIPASPIIQGETDKKTADTFERYIGIAQKNISEPRISTPKTTIPFPISSFRPYNTPQLFSAIYEAQNNLQFLSDENISPEEHESFGNYIRSSIDYSETDDSFTSEDIRIFHVVHWENTSVYFPPPTAPMATKRAWADTMKQLSPPDQINAKLLLLRKALHDTPEASDMSLKDRIIQYIAHITSYQPLFQQIITDLEKERKAVPQKQSNRLITKLIRISQKIIATLNEHQILQI